MMRAAGDIFRKRGGDFWMVTVSAAVITLFSFLLYQDMTRRHDAGSQQRIGTITFKHRVAQRKFFSQVIWEDLQQSEPLYNNDTIRTANLSDAVIQLSDGTRIDIGENTMILMSMAGDGINVNFAHGSLSASRKGARGEMKIQSKDAVVSLEKSDVKLTSVGGKGLDLTVSRGKALMKAGGEEKVVAEKERAFLAKDSKKAVVRALSFRLKSPPADHYLTALGPSLAVRFAWDEVKPGSGVSFQLSRSADFSSLMQTQAAPPGGISLSLSEGSYYWRLKKEGEGAAGEVSEVRKLVILRADPAAPLYPRAGETFQYILKPPLVTFRWTAGRSATGYLVEIAAEEGMKNPLRKLESADTSIAAELPRGVYYWRVLSRTGLAGAERLIAGPVRKFTVDVRRTLEAPRLISPTREATLLAGILRKRNLLFNWADNREIKSYQFLLARDADFKGVVTDKTVEGNYFSLAGGLKAGRYYWRVRGMQGKEALTKFSAAGLFTVAEGGRLQVSAPPDETVFAPEFGQKSVPVSFAWKRSEFRGRLVLQISSDRGFAKTEREFRTEDYGLTASDLAPCSYYWRVRMLDSDGSDILVSEPRKIHVRGPLAAPQITEPREGASVDMSRRGGISFSWKPLAGANLYECRLYRKGTRKELFSRKSSSLSAEFRDLARLDRGLYYWTLQAFETGKGGGVIRRSPEVRASFSVTLKKLQGKPKVKSSKVQFL